MSEINGIDVSKCEHHYTNPVNGIIYNGCAIYQQKNELGYWQDTLCEENPDCYFKQLKRLQKENEELRQVRKNFPDIQEPYVYLYRQIKKQCHKLEEENKELKKREITKNGFICDCEQNAKYKQALKEIREIAQISKKDICDNCGWQNSDCCEPQNYTCNEFIKILDKISEVLNDRD